MLKNLFILYLLLIWSNVNSQQRDFRGKVIYELRSTGDSGKWHTMMVSVYFSDSAVFRVPSEELMYHKYDFKKKQEIVVDRRSTDSVRVFDFDEVSDENSLTDLQIQRNDTVRLFGMLCEKATGVYSKSVFSFTSETRFEMYLSSLTYNCPPYFTDFDVMINNSFGRIPLMIKETRHFSESDPYTIEWKAVAIIPDSPN